jgi:hypothetical protein
MNSPPLPRLKDTAYGDHRWDTFEPKKPEPVLPWDDEPVDEQDVDSSPKDIESNQPPED